MRAVGAYIAERRERAGFTQDELAHKTGYSKNSISEYERGVRSPPFDKLARILKTIGGSIDIANALLLNDSASPESGRQLAEQHYSPEDQIVVAAALRERSDEEIEQFVQEVTADRDLLPSLRDIWRSLRDAVRGPKN